MSKLMLSLACLGLLFSSVWSAPLDSTTRFPKKTDTTVLILGGGVAGVIAARELHKAGVDFIIVEARSELGGRLMSTQLNGVTLELGANWVEGLHSDVGLTNPIYELVKKHKVKTVANNWDDLAFYDQYGVNTHQFPERFQLAADKYDAMVALAGERIARKQVDLTARSGYKLSGSKSDSNQYDKASEYYTFDWEYGQTPDQSSWIAAATNHNRTFSPVEGFGDDDLMCIDQRGYKTFLIEEARTFLRPSDVLFNSTVKSVHLTDNLVSINLTNEKKLTADHVLVTFSVGVLQHEDVVFKPTLPHWKREAIESMTMATYTKIFLQFDYKWWDDFEMGLYADPHKRGYYTVWQSLDHPRFFPGKHIYFVTLTGDESERIDTMSEAEIQKEMMEVLRSMYPQVQVPEPKVILFHRWFSDPLYRGSYSNWPPSFYPEHMRNLRGSVSGRLHWAGEATSLDYYGYLHGAFFEGRNRGQALAKCILYEDCNDLPAGYEFQDQNLEFPMYTM